MSAEVTVAYLPTCSPEGLRRLNGHRARYGLTRRAVATSQLRANREGTGEGMGVDQGSGVRVLEDPLTNKGTAFSEEERSELGLRGLLPAVVETLEQQVRRRYQAYREQPSDVARHINLRALQDTNETLFYRLVSEHAEEMLDPLHAHGRAGLPAVQRDLPAPPRPVHRLPGPGPDQRNP